MKYQIRLQPANTSNSMIHAVYSSVDGKNWIYCAAHFDNIEGDGSSLTKAKEHTEKLMRQPKVVAEYDDTLVYVAQAHDDDIRAQA